MAAGKGMRLGRGKARGEFGYCPGQWAFRAASGAGKLVGKGLRAEQETSHEATVRGGAAWTTTAAAEVGQGSMRLRVTASHPADGSATERFGVDCATIY